MDIWLFIGSITFILAASIVWGYKTLPGEKWQILAVVPQQKKANETYNGLNLTYYGVFSANAYTFAVIIFIILSAAADMPVTGLVILVIALLSVCMPAASIMARIVEKKRGTLTVGGAVFVGTLAAPVLVWTVNNLFGYQISATAFLAAASISYAFGEGLGRLACISFGCCYGKPLKDCSSSVQTLFSRFYLVYTGKTKKIAYASGLEGEKVIPSQIITAALYSVCGIVGIWLFLGGHFTLALMETLIITQVWRFVSEFFRADFRGGFSITPYQIMALTGLIYAFCIAVFFPSAVLIPVLERGLTVVWYPGMILLLLMIWGITFLYTGRSVVTGAELSLHVNRECI